MQLSKSYYFKQLNYVINYKLKCCDRIKKLGGIALYCI